MKNIHVLPTDKPNRLKQNKITKKISLVKNKGIDLTAYDPINIYITSDEEIKEDYVIAYGVVVKVMMFEEETLYFVNGTKAKREDCKKIILTTNQDLIKDSVQAIDDEFSEWLVEKPTCELVEVEKQERYRFEHRCDDGINVGYSDNITQYHSYKETSIKNWDKLEKELMYKIIIPEEESKQELKIGAEWQQERMYSEEEARSIWSAGQEYLKTSGDSITFEELTEQFKTKYPVKTKDRIVSETSEETKQKARNYGNSLVEGTFETFKNK